jgi:hypothetical protein
LAGFYYLVESDPEVEIVAVHAWSDRKWELFQPNHLRKAWQLLKEQDWLVAARSFDRFLWLMFGFIRYQGK